MPKGTIMVVEDEKLVALEIKEVLEKLGYDVPVVIDEGSDALKHVIDCEPDLVLMDIQLKGKVDGIDAAKLIHEIFNLPIIFLTAYSDDSTLQRSKGSDSFGYILKPFEERSLYVAIETALNKSKEVKQLKRSNQWLTTVLRSIGQGVIVSDLKGSIRFINSSAEAFSGWSNKDAYGRRLDEVFSILEGESAAPAQVPISKAIMQGESVRLENYTLVGKEGNKTAIDYSVAPNLNDQGNTVGLIVVFWERSAQNSGG